MIVLIDARSDSLTITWPEVPGAQRYILELKHDGTCEDNSNDAKFQELSSKLRQTQARKKNLSPDRDHWFRVAPVMADNNEQGSWIVHKEPFRTISLKDNQTAMEAPQVSVGGNKALVVRWKASAAAATDNSYELQMRDNQGGKEWTTVASNLKGTEARKKNLVPDNTGYQFRVRSSDASFSPPSLAVVARGLSEALRQRWFLQLNTLLKTNPDGTSSSVPLEDALGGKEFVLFYVSAHWCPPCRQYTPMLANWYHAHKHSCEIVFVSADHDASSFRTYFDASHPWSAIDFDADEATRQTLMVALRVQGIPRLVVVNAATGAIVENNAVGTPLDVTVWRDSNKRKRPQRQM